MGTLKTLKSWFYPVTPLTIVTPFSIAIAIYAIYLGFTLESPAIIYPIIVVPITALIVGLYVLDRFLVKKHVPYYLLLIAELVLLAGGYLLFNYADSTIDYANSTTDIHITTDKDYIFVLYDSRENSMDRFKNSNKVLVNDNILHLDPSLRYRDDIRILPPNSWISIGEQSGNYFYKGDSIPYIYKVRSRQANEYARFQQTYIDSLLTLALQK